MPAGRLHRALFVRFGRRMLAVVIAGLGCASTGGGLRTFPDRPVAWHEHDDAHVAAPPRALGLEREQIARLFRGFFTREVDRALTFESARAADDVNALDEVPCSTWYCPRHHLAPMDADAMAAGPPGVFPAEPPLTISIGKTDGTAPGFVARDAHGRKYLVKLDPAGRPGLASGGEVIGNRIFHAAGYHVPGAFSLRFVRSDLRVASGARISLSGVAERPFTEAQLDQLLQVAARDSDGAFRAMVSPWLPGKVLGGFDFMGRRDDDPNDRIPHEHRRSLRATYVFYGWLNVADPGPSNCLDSYVEESGRRFVRHYLLDFGTGFGAGTDRIKYLPEGREHTIEVGRTLAAALTAGIYQREWQKDAGLWRRFAQALPDVGWYHPIDDWRPDRFRPGDKLPAHVRMTARDGYWAAKVITSFTDADLRAVVAAAGYPPESAAYLEQALRGRRDRIGEHYLRAYAAVEAAAVSPDGKRLCFQDLAIARGYARAESTRYDIGIGGDGSPGSGRRWTVVPGGAETCLPFGAAARSDYLVVSIGAAVDGRSARPTSVHLRWRAAESRMYVVGIERAD